MGKTSDAGKDEEEVARQRDAALRRALSTPPKPKQEKAKVKVSNPEKRDEQRR